VAFWVGARLGELLKAVRQFVDERQTSGELAGPFWVGLPSLRGRSPRVSWS
jgi:hypothetical protein